MVCSRRVLVLELDDILARSFATEVPYAKCDADFSSRSGSGTTIPGRDFLTLVQHVLGIPGLGNPSDHHAAICSEWISRAT